MFDLKNIPINPGCYLLKNKKGNIIYIGKAKNLKKRVKTYFQKKNLDVKTIAMLSHVESADFIVTENDRFYSVVYSLYKASSEPKELKMYPGSAHAQHIFKSEHEKNLTSFIIRFLDE